MTDQSADLIIPTPTTITPAPPATDEQAVALWLWGRPASTVRVYLRVASAFQRHLAGRALAAATISDVQSFLDRYADDSQATRATTAAVIKSLLAYLHTAGLLPVNVGTAIRVKAPLEAIHTRLLSPSQVHAMIGHEHRDRNRLLLRLLYASGCRLSEISQLRWEHVTSREGGAVQITVTGKGGRVRAILLPPGLSADLLAHRPPIAEPADPLFVSRQQQPLSGAQIDRIVAAAAQRAGIVGRVSAHWLRHAHASHALERGAPLPLVRDALGHTNIATTSRYVHARPTDGTARYLVD